MGWVVGATPLPLYPRERDAIRIIVQDVGWAPGPVWSGAEILPRTGFQSPARQTRSGSLYRLSYRKIDTFPLNQTMQSNVTLDISSVL
jgi:hypothetical protein